MTFNFGRSLTHWTWAVFLIVNYTCNSSWSECNWGAKSHLLVGTENAGHALKPDFRLHIGNVCAVVSLDSSGKQTNKQNLWDQLFRVILANTSSDSRFSFPSKLFWFRKTQSKRVQLKRIKQMMVDRRRSLIRPRVHKCPTGLPALSFNSRVRESKTGLEVAP